MKKYYVTIWVSAAALIVATWNSLSVLFAPALILLAAATLHISGMVWQYANSPKDKRQIAWKKILKVVGIVVGVIALFYWVTDVFVSVVGDLFIEPFI